MSGYTVFVNGTTFDSFFAIDDSHALLFALGHGLQAFTLCRTGINNTVLRTVAEVNNDTAC